ncbi:MAG: MFS transporter [Planctomycetota bacterium]|jgi:nucleoside transporter
MSETQTEIEPALSSPLSLRVRLSAMMFMQYFTQGCYLPVASLYLKDHLKFTSWQLGLFGSAVAFGAVLAPFISGQLADRYFRTERFIAFSHLVAGTCMGLIKFSGNANVILFLAFAYSLLYVPTISLTNMMCFRNLKRVDYEFPRARVWGTIGFITPLWLFDIYWFTPLLGDPVKLAEARGDTFLLSGITAYLMAVYCLTLPATPPKRDAIVKFAPAEAFQLLGNRAFLTILLVSFPIAAVHKFHFVWNTPFLKKAGVAENWIGRATSIGQIFEIGVMIALGFFISRLGFKKTILLGIGAYVARNSLFALLPYPAVAIVAQALHGFCFACFFAASFMLVDRLAPRDSRASVQTTYGVIALGVGAFAGGWFAGSIGDLFSQEVVNANTGVAETVYNYTNIWLSAAVVSVVSFLYFALCFPAKPEFADHEPTPTAGEELGDDT